MNTRLLRLFSGFPTHHFTDAIAQTLLEDLPRRENLILSVPGPEDYAQNDDNRDAIYEMFAEHGKFLKCLRSRVQPHLYKSSSCTEDRRLKRQVLSEYLSAEPEENL